MAANRLHSSFRHEGHIFFIYDHRVKTEEDDPSDAILYFYPRSITTDQQIAIVGGIIGITDFCLEFLPQSMPTVIKLNGHKFALLQHEEFIIGLACREDIPDNFLVGHMQFVWSTFILYQGSLGAIRERVCEENFVKELKRIWDMYLPLCQIHSDPLSQAFKVLPYVQLHKSQGSLYLHASHILQRTLRYKGVVAGALFSWKKVLCSQLSNSLTRQLLLLMTQSEFPCVEANSVLELPGGVRLLHVFIPEEEYKKLSHRRKKVFNSHSLPMAVTDLSWADQLPHSSNQTASQASTAQHGALDRNMRSDKNSQGQSDMYNTASEGSRSSKGRWSFPRQDSAISPSAGGGITSGTDSEVFMDTLTEASFDWKQPATVPEEKLEEGCVETIEPSFILNQSRGSDLYVPPRGYTSSSEPNTPEQRNVVVFAEVHNNAYVNLARGTPEYLRRLKCIQKDFAPQKESNPDEVLVFGHTISTSNDQNIFTKSSNSAYEEKFKTGLDEETFSSISNLRSDEGKGDIPNNSQRSKVVGTIVDFIRSSSERKNPQIVSKTVVTNGVLPSSHCDEAREESKSSADISKDKKLSDVEKSGVSSQNYCISISALDSSESQPPSEDLTSDFVDIGDHLSSGVNPQTSSVIGSLHSELRLQGNFTADKLALNNSDPASEKLQNQVSSDLNESSNQVETLSMQVERDTDSNLPVSISSSKQEELKMSSVNEVLVYQNQNEAVNILIGTSMYSETDPSQVEKSQIKDTMAESKGEVSLSSSSSRESRNQSEDDSSVRQAVTCSKQEIDASLEVRLSGDESSALSSSEHFRHSMDSSTLSLAPSDLGPSKMRLVFEASESDNSDTGIMSPLSERGLARGNCLSPVEELKTDSTSKKTFRGGNEDYSVRRLSSDCESRHVKGSQGDKSADSSVSASWEPVDAGPNEVEPTSDQASARWNPGKSKLHKMTLYAQGHSDTLLLLLLSKNASCSKSYINSLWKTCLSHLAELDFEVKDAERHMRDDSENIGAAYQYMRYDSFSQSLKGSALLPVSSLANEIVDTCVKMHDTFETMPDVQDITYRSHSACCFGHRAINTETYFQLGQPRNASGICAQNDRTFSLDQLAGRILQNDVKISVL